MNQTSLEQYSEEEVSKHNKEQDIWIIIGSNETGGRKVYDVTKYLTKHPGGSDILLKYAGRDADDIFELTGHSDKARESMKKFLIGTIKDTKTKVSAASAPSTAGDTPVTRNSWCWLALGCGWWVTLWGMCCNNRVGNSS